MIASIAWRNIWRNRTRSLVVMGSVMLGLWAGAFVLAFAWGLYQNNIHDTIYRQYSHFQVHHPSFPAESDPRFILSDSGRMARLRADKSVRQASSRLMLNGMISSPANAFGVRIFGIVPADEKQQLQLEQLLQEGEYVPAGKGHQIYIGRKLADKLKVKLKNKVVLSFSDSANNIISTALRISGIYKSRNTSLDESQVYMLKNEMAGLLGTDTASFHEVAILLSNDTALNAGRQMLGKLFPGRLIRSWKVLSPETDMVVSSFNLYMYIVIGIILLALTFGIVNTMLMAVLERVRELGVLTAIGMNKRKTFLMIMTETVYLAMLGGPLGLGLSWLTVRITGTYGINLGAFDEGFSQYGFSSMVYPVLENDKYFIIAGMTLVTAVLASVYPALRALKLQPVEAIRKI